MKSNKHFDRDASGSATVVCAPLTESEDSMTRRRFIKSGALVVSVAVPFGCATDAVPPVVKTATASAAAAAATPPPPKPYVPTAAGEVNAWVIVNPDESVIVRIARSEMGQGILTGLSQLVAEELECDWAKVTTEYPTPGKSLANARAWGDFATGGSRGLRGSQEYMRKGGATARAMLVQAAAEEWKVPASECTTSKGVISHAASGKKTTYGKVANAASKLEPPKDVKVKDSKAWALVGKRMARLDTIDKTTGKQIYGMDLKLPNMLNAAIKDCPVFGGKVKSYDEASALKMPGVKKVVKVGDSGVAVVADTWWRAQTALQAMKIEWDEGKHANASSEAFDKVLKTALDSDENIFVGNESGDIKKSLKEAKRVVEATYSYAHQNHACMETMNATAIWTESKCEVWTPTQNGEAALAATAEAAGLKPEQCEVYKVHLGGGFGRRGALHDWVRQAVSIAKTMPGTPVKLIWSREEDMLHGLYHPITQCKLKAALDDAGNITGVHMRIAGQSILAGLLPQRLDKGKDPVVFQGLNPSGPESAIGYSFDNILVDHAMRNPHVPPGFWRGVNLNQNAFYLECFIDEIAHATKQDPLALRQKLMAKHPKHLAVLNAAAERAGWGKPAAQGVFRGLAQTHGFGSYVAACAEVSVSAKGDLKIHRIVAATDCGHAVNPQQIEAQVEGSFVYGLSAALYSQCTVKEGRIQETNFTTYPVMKTSTMPKVETIILESGGFWGGVGEPTIAVAAPAVMNAVFAATGKRIRDLPMLEQLLKKA
jgi:isoquinoline 1-oxidoreductase subunit beta